MEKIDVVVVGAEGVVESGGIINKVSETARLGTDWTPRDMLMHRWAPIR